MRTILAVMLFSASASAAPLISPAAKLPVIHEVPKACADSGRLANSPRVQLALSARVTLAECMANETLRAQKDLIDSQDSIAALEAGMAKSFELLDQAIATDDPKLVVVAQHAKGAIYAAMTQRMLAAVPPLPPSPTTEQVQLRSSRAAVLATWMQPWRDKQHEAFAAVIATVQQHEKLATDPVLANAIADAKRKLQSEPAVVADAPNS